MPPYRNYIYEYHAKITSGEIIAGKWIKKIYEIIINGLQKQEYFFNAKAANKAIRFIATGQQAEPQQTPPAAAGEPAGGLGEKEGVNNAD